MNKNLVFIQSEKIGGGWILTVAKDKERHETWYYVSKQRGKPIAKFRERRSVEAFINAVECAALALQIAEEKRL